MNPNQKELLLLESIKNSPDKGKTKNSRLALDRKQSLYLLFSSQFSPSHAAHLSLQFADEHYHHNFSQEFQKPAAKQPILSAVERVHSQHSTLQENPKQCTTCMHACMQPETAKTQPNRFLAAKPRFTVSSHLKLTLTVSARI